MRKLGLLALTLALAAAIATPASALDLGSREFRGKFEDHSTLFRNGSPVGAQVDPTLAFQIGDEQRTVLRVTNLRDLDTGEFFYDTSSPTELTGVIYDLEIVQIQPTAAGTVLDFAPANRNPLTDDQYDEASGATGKDALTSVGAPDAVGGVVELYEGTVKNYTPDPGPDGIPNSGDEAGRLDSVLPTNTSSIGVGNPVTIPANGGPNQWTEGNPPAGHLPGATPGAGGADAFPTVTDGNWALSGALVDLQFLADQGVLNDPALGPDGVLGTVDDGVAFADNTVLRETINLSAGAGFGFGYLNVFGLGSLGPDIQSDFHGPYADLSLDFDLRGALLDGGGDGTATVGNNFLRDSGQFSGPGYWTTDSQDPITGRSIGLIPEPATMTLLGLALVGLVGLGRKKRN